MTQVFKNFIGKTIKEIDFTEIGLEITMTDNSTFILSPSAGLDCEIFGVSLGEMELVRLTKSEDTCSSEHYYVDRDTMTTQQSSSKKYDLIERAS